jgi:enamine deaminase RidA (YjgF/YER057c/UK114 family)
MTPGGVSHAPRLWGQRLSVAEWRAMGVEWRAQTALGSLVYGRADAKAGQAPADSGTVALAPAEPQIDAWCSEGPLAHGRCGSVRWSHNGHWLFGALELDEGATGDSLTTLSVRAYREVFETLAHTGCDHLLRLWNYLPGINADAGGMERYRQFNSGRQQAFLEAGQAAFEGAPAACALGTRDGPLRVRFLAGRHAAVPIENPRQTSAYHYPRDYGPHSPTFSRAALADAGGGQVALLISGTSSIVGHESVHVGDVAAQTRETLANLRAVIESAHQRCSARFDLATADCVIYVRRGEDAARVCQIFEAEVGADSPAARKTITLEADICRADLQVEIEAHAFAPGEVNP